MDTASFTASVMTQWDSLTSVEALLDAIERGDLQQVRTLTAVPAVRSALDTEISTRADVLSSMAVSPCKELQEKARAAIRAEPELAVVRSDRGQTLLHRAAGSWQVISRYTELIFTGAACTP